MTRQSLHIITLLTSISIAFPFLLQAKDLGVHGRVYEIQENDLLSVLQSRAQAELDSGKWAKRVEEWQGQAKQQANRPNGIILPRATETTSHLYDPSIIVPKDIKDSNGLLLRAAGSQVNPLSYISMTRNLVFIDGDDRAQVDWMVQLTGTEPGRYKIILTQGSVIDLMKELNRQLFFDQKQVYTRKMGIKSLPVLVYQSGLYLRIDEVAIQ